MADLVIGKKYQERHATTKQLLWVASDDEWMSILDETIVGLTEGLKNFGSIPHRSIVFETDGLFDESAVSALDSQVLKPTSYASWKTAIRHN